MDVAEEAEASIHWPDWLVIAIVLLISASIGVYYRFSGGRQKTAEEYFTANHSMSVPLLALALMVAFMSAIAMLGISGENYIYGTEFTVSFIGFAIGTPIAAFFYLPVFYKLEYVSVYEYLERRFGVTARLVASIATYLQLLLYTGVVLYAPSLALEATTGLSSVTSVLLIGLICTFYSSIGGIKAVLATDVFQGLLMFASTFCIIGVVWYDIEGGLLGAWEKARKGGRIRFDNINPDPTERHSLWSLIIGGIFFFLSSFAVNQIHVQRLLSAKTLRSAQGALFLNTPIIMCMGCSTALSGIMLYAWFEGCDPVASGQVVSFDQVMPYFAKIRMSKISGLTGFFIAGIFSASLSTVSAILNSLAAIALSDYIKPLYKKLGHELPDSKATLFAKILAVINGLLCVSIAFLSSQLGSLMQAALAINGALGGPILGLFSIGMFFESANENGAVIGTVLSLIFAMWVIFGQPKPPVIPLPVSVDNCPNSTREAIDNYHKLVDSWKADDTEYFYLYRLSYMWYTPLGFVTTLLFGYIASLVYRYLSKISPVELDPDLFTPIVAARMRRRREDPIKMTTSQRAFYPACEMCNAPLTKLYWMIVVVKQKITTKLRNNGQLIGSSTRLIRGLNKRALYTYQQFYMWVRRSIRRTFRQLFSTSFDGDQFHLSYETQTNPDDVIRKNIIQQALDSS